MNPADAARKTILIAGNTLSVRDRFAAALRRGGHETFAAHDAADLLARVRADAERLDLLIVDLGMPPRTGVDLVRDIRDAGGGRVPILVFSGTLGSARDVRVLAELGVVGYINEFSSDTQILPSVAPHLFPDNFNRRGSLRVVLGIPIAYRVANTIAAAVTLNLGKGGLAIRTMSPLDSASRARVRFRLPHSKRDVDADARVTWSDRRAGMGLQFERIDPTDQTAIDSFVEGQYDEV